MTFQGSPRDGGYCLRWIEDPLNSPCERPFGVGLYDRASLSDSAERDYCGINQQLTTCEAVLALKDDDRCESDDDCPLAGLCRTVGAAAGRCTYECGHPSQCIDPGDFLDRSTCGNALHAGEGPEYCGGEAP